MIHEKHGLEYFQKGARAAGAGSRGKRIGGNKTFFNFLYKEEGNRGGHTKPEIFEEG